ncbi:IQ and AAA domain-containing protein 1 [Fopius arisanus]|uniref:IQ and AAA domain-containing protein 1 n=1 Tax=Fopius arisanus TaxID=64838 RepID=A0A9R1TYM4_9HYME|nr:PREDICTED: IQ and AAA domain-containing protein 1-like [Fopius arisanus]
MGSLYDDLWHSAQERTDYLLGLDGDIQADQTPRSRNDAVKMILPIYIKYKNLIKKLAQLYDRMIHSQKRQLIKRLFNCSVGRMLEYRRELVKLTCSDYHWPDDLLIELKWTPDDVQIPSIASYTSDRKKELEEREKNIEDLLDKLNAPELEDEDDHLERERPSAPSLTRAPSMVRRRKSLKVIITPQLPVPTESEEERIIREREEARRKAFADAISLIQRHERARIGRVIGTNASREQEFFWRLKFGEIEVKKYRKEVKEKAARIIQKTWRGYRDRKFLEERREKREMAMGMIIPSRRDKTVIETDLGNRLRIAELQQEFGAAVDDRIAEERSKIFESKRFSVMDDISEEIRAWFQEWLQAVGHFDVYPPEQNGGSAMIVLGQTLTPEEFLVKKSEEMNKEELKKGKDEKKSPKGKNKKEVEGWTPPESKILQMMMEVKNEFVSNWSLRDEKLRETANIEMIKEEIFYELQLETRKAVDELMRLELDRMNDALIKDHKNDDPKFIFPGMKKGKKKKKEKKGRKKPGDDLGKKEEADQMFRELVSSGIIKNYPKARLSDWSGDLSYQNFEAQRDFKEYNHKLGEIKNIIIETCILPLGSKEAHTIAPLLRSLCIMGLPRTGKKFLAHAIANEIGALLFDLTPRVLSGRYEGRENEKRLMRMINTVAKNYPPSIVLIDGGDIPWMKKIPPEEKENQPKRLAKLLPKFIKTIKPGDQILVLGLASEPWKANKKFSKMYDNFIAIPVSDYNSVYLFYQDVLMRYHNVNRHFDVSAVARASVGYSLDVIREAVENVMNLRRRMRLRFEPLRPEEILKELERYPRISEKILTDYAKFQMKTPLGRKLAKMRKEQENNEGN